MRALTLQLFLAIAVAGPAVAQEAGFVVLAGADTIAVERFSRTPERIQGELAIRTQSVRMSYRGALSPDALVPELEMEATPPGAVAPVRLAVSFRGDSAFASVRGSGAPPEQRFAPGAGALPYLNLSGAILEQIARRALAVGGDPVEIPMLGLGGGQIFRAQVSRISPDSLRILLPPAVEIRARVDAEGRLLGAAVPSQRVTVVRVDSPPAIATAAPPDYSAPAGAPYTAENVGIPTPAGHVLAGTLTLPEDRAARVPAVVLISGSGPQDRDESLPMLPGYRPFREIADTLSRRGVAVLRYDDRGFGQSTGNFAGATTADFAQDARAALAYLRARPEIDPARLGLVGHSEGGLIAPLVAAEDSSLRAIALLAAPSHTGRRILDDQSRYAIGRDTTLTAAQREAALAGIAARIDSASAAQPWVRFFVDHDPLEVARRLRVPVLILHGATDRQVTAGQAGELAEAFRAGGNRDVTVRVLPGVNHLFLPDPSGDPAGYSRLAARELVPEARGVLADWVVERL